MPAGEPMTSLEWRWRGKQLRCSQKFQLVGADWNHGILTDFPEFQKQLGSWNNIPTDELAYFSEGWRAQPPTSQPWTWDSTSMGFHQPDDLFSQIYVQQGLDQKKKKTPPKMKMSPSNIRIWPMNFGIYTAISCKIWIQSKHNQWICLRIGYLKIWQHVHKQSHGVCVVGQSWAFVRFVCWMWNILLERDDHGSSSAFGKSPWQGVLTTSHDTAII